MLGNIGPLEIGIVLIIALIVFGPKRLPELGNALGNVASASSKTSITGNVKDDDDGAKQGARGRAGDRRARAPSPLSPRSCPTSSG